MSDRSESPLSKRRLTICIVGSGGVGKSSLTVRYLQGTFPEFYDPTIEESYIAQVEYGFDLHDVEIIDTAGQEEFLLFRDSSISHGDAFLMLFSIDQLSSWHTLQELRKKIVREKEDEDCKVPIVIVANKKDLESARKLSLEETVEYCRSIDCPLMEISAKTGLNVTECFRLVMERLAELKPKEFHDSIITPFEEPPKRKTCVVS